MNEKDFNIKQYPKSAHKFQCLGPCYAASTVVVHPMNLEMVTDNSHPFCTVTEWTRTDEVTGRKKDVLTDRCMNPTAKVNESGRNFEINILLPYMDFGAEKFLKIYYSIYSIEDALDWVDMNKHLPLDNKMRVMRSALSVFGSGIDIVDNRFSAFFELIIKKRFIDDIYSSISIYVGMSDDKDSMLIVSPKKNKLKYGEMIVERTNFILATFLGPNSTYKFLTRYFKQQKDTWETITDHLTHMVKDLIEYIDTKINIMLRN